MILVTKVANSCSGAQTYPDIIDKIGVGPASIWLITSFRKCLRLQAEEFSSTLIYLALPDSNNDK